MVRRALAAPVVVAVLVMVVWGATPVLTRIALEDMEPLVVATLRTILAGLLAVPLLLRAREPFPRAAPSRRLLAVSAAAGFVVFPVVYTIGQERTSGLHGVMILAALPIFTGLYAAAVARRVPGRGWLLGCAIALAGEVVLIGARGGGTGDATLTGDLLVLAAALVVSAGYVAGALLPTARRVELGGDVLGRRPRRDRPLAARDGALRTGRAAGRRVGARGPPSGCSPR